MERMEFYKLDGAANDFVVVDNRDGMAVLDEAEVARICHRRRGVGADGLMTLDASDEEGVDFVMHYYNSDGRLGSMCGNGGRCIAMLAHLLGMGERLRFRGYDGMHEAEVIAWDTVRREGTVRLGMRSVGVGEMVRMEGGVFVDTGSPHLVIEVDDLWNHDVVGEGRRWRNRQDLFPQGANIDFVERMEDGRLAVRTYERGVEDETWACGTGVTACAIACGVHNLTTRGGDFEVEYTAMGEAYEKVWLTGPVALNYTGIWTYSAR